MTLEKYRVTDSEKILFIANNREPEITPTIPVVIANLEEKYGKLSTVVICGRVEVLITE